MSTPRIAFVNAAHDGADTLKNFRRELDADLVEFHVTEGTVPTDFEFDAAVVSGSRASVYWDEDWIQPTREWVGEAAERMPVLGVCFGHQLLADALGGTVEGMDEYEIGYRTVSKTRDDPLLDGLGEEFLVFTTHSDAVTELPPDAELLAENDYGVHGFRKGDAVGVQFHPEYDMETAESVTRRKDDLPAERKDAVTDGITPENFEKACEAKRLFENFTEYARSASAAD
ncbi:type 1 glutamine amidotransferase [Salarchaeum japonicum]|uniref:Type 1 glutamine amidotransferase n=1 Tax=Salarchaeum japonicum TaxID=555573 RepID=A0AAV3T0T4_9EURY|nr:type 1 glutamine amidotransferase [Salarchaeum japonicum]